MAAETSIHALDETGISRDPPRLPQEADRRALGLADTAATGPGSLAGADTLQSGAPAGALVVVPPRIGRFLVIRTLGAGGMGLVVEAYDPELDRKVAIKLLRGGKPGGDSQTRLLREAQAMARLSHPNVVQIYDVGVVGDQVFLAMELVRGQTLAAWFEAERRGWRDVVRVFLDAARGLAAAHKVGLVHRDFKPDNVLLADDGRVCVADFGLAREERGAGDLGDPGDPGDPGDRGLLGDTLTVTGVLMGTPMYMSPEQHRGEAAGPASDIFSFAVALHEGLHGRRPFAGDTLAELAKNVHAGAMVPTPSGHGVPAFVDALVRRCLSVRPGDRCASFDEVIAALDRDPAATRRRRLLFAAGGAAVIGAVAFAVAARPPEPCGGGPERIAEVWNDGHRTLFSTALAGISATEREALEPRIVGGLDGYADAWAELHRGVCLTHQAGESSASLLDAQMRCLEVRRQALAGAAEVIGAGEPAVVREAAMIVARLPALAHCGDAAALLAEVPPPEDAAAAAEVEQLRGRLARARVLADAGRGGDGLALAAEVEARGEALRYRPLVAEASLVAGRIALDSNRPVEAEDALARAHVVATAARADAIAAEAEVRRLYLAGIQFGRHDQVLGEVARAEALIDRLGERRDLRAILASTVGGVHLHRGEAAAARERFAEAIALADGDPRTDPIDLARGALNNAAIVATTAEERDRLFGRAHGILEAKLGPLHPATLTLGLSWASQIDAPAAARERLAATCEGLMTRRDDLYDRCGECHLALGHLEDALDHRDAAAAAMDAVGRCFDVAIVAGDEGIVAAQRTLAGGHAALLRGDASAALESFTASAAIWRPQAEAWWIAPSLADVLIGRARAQIALGRGGDAVADLEEAITRLQAHVVRDPRAAPKRLLERAQGLLAGVQAAP